MSERREKEQSKLTFHTTEQSIFSESNVQRRQGDSSCLRLLSWERSAHNGETKLAVHMRLEAVSSLSAKGDKGQ